MHLWSRLASSLLALAPLASAQTLLLQEDFDTGLGAWQAENQWHWEEPGSSTCPSTSGASPQGGGAARWGTGCTFEGALAGSLTLLEPVTIPATANTPFLRFRSYMNSEGCFEAYWGGIWDVGFVYASRDGGATWDELTRHCESQVLFAWRNFDVSLGDYRGDDVLIRFHFDAFDSMFNGGFGWVIDDVRITTGACSAVPYCPPTANSFSPTGAIVGHSGTRRISNNDFVLTVDDAPAGQFGHFFFGPDQVSTPVADGNLCVGAGALGILRLTPAGAIDAQGHYERHLDFPSTLGSPLAIVAGGQWNFQYWFRDPTGGPSGSNFSSALRVTFCE